MPLNIRLGDLRDPRIATFLQAHLEDMHRVSPPESVHALDLDALRQPEIQFWSGWWSDADEGVLVASAALKRLSATQGELKSMRTDAAWRGRGIGSAMLSQMIKKARAMGWQQLSLETGTQAFFEPACALYLRHGFEDCLPFADYQVDPCSRYMTLRL